MGNLSSDIDALEVLRDPPGEVPDWSEVTQTRLAHLAALNDSSNRWWRRRSYQRRLTNAARTEHSYITALRIVHAVAEILDDTQRSHTLPPWRMPADGYVRAEIHRRWPHLLEDFDWDDRSLPSREGVHILEAALHYHRLDVHVDVSSIDHTLDAISRAVREKRDPTPSPFLPITHRRALREDHVRFFENQEQRNLHHLAGYAPQLLAHKNHQRQLPAVVFQNPHLDLSVPSGLVAYHQIGCPLPHEISSPRDRRLVRVVKRHLELKEGDVVRYRHVRSATLSTRWQPGLAYSQSTSLNEPSSTEMALRLELAPQRGLYFGAKVSTMVKANPVDEREIVLPPQTTWRVVGVRDVIQPNVPADALPPVQRFRSDEHDDRLRAILMVEVDDVDAPPDHRVIDMSEPFGE